MAIYPDNDNYTVDECGAIVIKNNNATSVNITLNTANIMIGKSSNNCELGNIFAVRKDNINTNDRYFARGYITYHDQNGNTYTAYSNNTISTLIN